MVDLDIICAGLAGVMVSSVILRCVGCTYSNFKSNPLRCSSKFLLSKVLPERNRNKEGLALENGNENYGGRQTSTEKASQSAGISTEKMASLLLLVATLAASSTYQAGLNPPGGSWERDSYHGRTSALNTAGVLIALTACVFAVLLHFAKTATLLWSFIHYNSNRRRHNMMFNGHTPVDREKSMGTLLISESDRAAVDEEDSSNRKQRESCWILASAAVHHMTGSLRLLATGGYSPMNGDEVRIVHDASTGKSLRVLGCGSVRTETMSLDDVWYVPGLHSNLVSTGQLARQGYGITLGPGGCSITRGDDALVGSARFVDGHRFELTFLNVPSSASTCQDI